MLSRLQIRFEKPEGLKIHHSIASKFHGMIMDNVESDVADYLHKPVLKPFSQSVLFEKKRIFWEICGVNEYAYENILIPLSKKNIFQLNALPEELRVESQSMEWMTNDQFFSRTFQEKNSRRIRLNFLSATAFRSQESYVFTPRLDLILQSIVNKYDTFMEQSISNDESFQQILDNLAVNFYDLRSVKYKIAEIYVPGFIGKVEYYVRGPQQLVNLVNYMFQFASFSGIGIKTSLGMGNVKVEGGDTD